MDKKKLSSYIKLSKAHTEALEKLGIHSVEDLLRFFPTRYADISEIKTISQVDENEYATIYARIEKIGIEKAFGGRPAMTKAVLSDLTGKVNALWFNQPYIAKMYPEGTAIKISGKFSSYKGKLSVQNPTVAKTKMLPIDGSGALFHEEGTAPEDSFLTPIYRETKNITSLFIYHSIKKIIASGFLDTLVDPLPEKLLSKYNLPNLKEAFLYIHFPKTEEHTLVAKKRFAFEEIFYIQLEKNKERLLQKESGGFIIDTSAKEIDSFMKTFPFSFTESQKKVLDTVLGDFKKGVPVSRLIEGDVGSGKTAVAAVLTHAAITTRPKKTSGEYQNFGSLQVAYMAPTEILAKQHFENFCSYFQESEHKIGLITSSSCFKFPSKTNKNEATKISKKQLSSWVENGEIGIVIGTHSLIQKNVVFKHLGLCIIDEQHRFGVEQRKLLAGKRGTAHSSLIPHLISMTATPIPRTLALTIYGDLDLSVLDGMPAGRKAVITEIVLASQREAMYQKVQKQIDEGRQVYVICPRIDDPDEDTAKKLQLKSVLSEAARLKKDIFKKEKIEVLHGKMKSEEKEKVMNRWSSGEIDILVATSVVEVGVSVANATVIIIEGSERFGLSQLHQLRGRVIRGTHQPYAYIVTENSNEKTQERLRLFAHAKNGFELAEMDLQIRGSGGLSEGKQWGVSDIAMEALKNVKLVEAARHSAKDILQENLDLSSYPTLAEKMEERKKTHLE